MNKNRVTVYVGGRRLVLISSESEDYIKNIAISVNERIDMVSKAYPQLDARGCAVMTALDYADDEKKALGKKAELVEQANKVLRQADKQSKQIIELKKQNDELDKKYDELSEKYEDLKKKNSNLITQYNELKKFLDKQISIVSQNKKEAEKEKVKENNKKPIAHGSKESAQKENAKKESTPKESKAEKDSQQINTNSKNKNQVVLGKDNTKKPDKKVNEDIVKPETAADIMGKGYVPLRQYSLFDDENK